MFKRLTSSFWVIPVLLLTLLTLSGAEQKEQYRFPLNERPVALSGTFGELRGNHFHSGLDIKTGGETGKKLYAIQDGWVYRLKVSPYGFGQAVYLRHADGRFSVYAHISGFSDKLAEYIYQEQYATKSYSQEIYLSENEIPIKEGELIAFSGNSGSSTGPHLHFEIREPDERIINPLQYYKDIITDHKKPILSTVAFEPLRPDSRVEGKFEKHILKPSGSNGNYSLPGTIRLTGKTGLEYHAWDLLDGAGNHCGINDVRLYLDNKQIWEFSISKFSFDEKKYINQHFDYQHYKETRRKFQRCYLDHGNKFSAYKNLVNGGEIDLEDDKVHKLRLELEDAHGNKSVLNANVQREVPSGEINLSGSGKSWMTSEVRRSVLIINVHNPSSAHKNGIVAIDKNGTETLIGPAYRDGKKLVFLYPLNQSPHPQKVSDPVSGAELDFNFTEAVYPFRNNIVEMGKAKFYFPYESVFDTLHPEITVQDPAWNTYSSIYRVGSIENPLYKSFVMNITPEKAGSPTHMVMAYRPPGGRWRYLDGGLNDDGTVYGSSGYFGEFAIMADSNAPKVWPHNFRDGDRISSSQKSLIIKVTDNFSGIDDEKMLLTLDGRWILGEYDLKTASVTYQIKERPAPGKHIVEIIVYDVAGNLSSRKYNLTF